MKFSKSWVSQFTNISDLTAQQIKEALWGSLTEVENVEDWNAKYKGLLVAKVLEVKKHPESDKLYVVLIDLGDRQVTVVAGAGNIKPGDFVPYTPVGIAVPYNPNPARSDGVIRAKKIGGIVSNGMLNSELELGLGEDHSKIMILKQEELNVKLKPGMPLAKALGLDDYIFEIENKALTHRGDCFSTVGIARELGAILRRPFDELKSDPVLKTLKPNPQVSLSVEISNPQAAKRYSAVVIEIQEIKESPLWLKVLLIKHGIKPRNIVVDVTNYVMLLLGQPLHAFDYDVVGDEIKVRNAQDSESIKTLDGRKHSLNPQILVIADREKPVAIAGIIGGLESSVTASTKRVILESATFDMYAIRRASMSLGIFTDAAAVFSRYQDPNKTLLGLGVAVDMLKKYAGARIISDIIDEYPTKVKPKTLTVSIPAINQFIGIDIPSAEVVEILSRLGFKVKRHGDKLELVVPTFRGDINLPVDIYEEVARIYGYGKIPQKMPVSEVKFIQVHGYVKFDRFVRDRLVEAGGYEMVNFNFIGEQLYSKLGLPLDDAFKIVNAVSEGVEYIRTLLMPSLLSNAAYNLKYFDSVSIFEIGKTYRRSYVYSDKEGTVEYPLYLPPMRFNKADEIGLPAEDKHVGFLVAYDISEPVYYWAKRALDYLLGKLHIDFRIYHPDDLSDKAKKQVPVWIKETLGIFKKGRVGLVVSNVEDKNIYLGLIGEVSSKALANLGITTGVAGFELQYHVLYELADTRPKFVEPSKYPAVVQDLCFVVDKDLPYQALIDTIKLVNKDLASRGKEPLIREILPVDIYSPDPEDKKKQITVRIVFQSNQKTLADKQIEYLREKIVKKVENQLGGRLKA